MEICIKVQFPDVDLRDVSREFQTLLGGGGCPLDFISLNFFYEAPIQNR